MKKQRFSFYHKEQKTLWGRSRVWLILSLLAFVVSWLFLHMLDRYMALQPELLKLSVPPNITEALLLPLSQNLMTVMLLVVAVTAGGSVAQERQEGTLDYLWRIPAKPWFHLPIMAKFKSHLWLTVFPLLMLFAVAALLTLGGDVDWLLVSAMGLALLLGCAWLIALALWLSSLANQAGFAVLLTLVVFILMWVIGGQSALDEYGINWLNLLLPEQHLNWLSQGKINLSSLLYFVGGTTLFLLMAQLQINNLKRQR
ncbi:ABC transporter permease [Marinicella gelatinilytica]|uniref:ABC transporter permease n=1 Tax=Marinicella gelatinilytica TaxID=2996017 RepID=UPI002260AE7E|nr:hypothetical protein [Marinicella gelatinilytica]MCX7543792.1 hypothetical protein [Marinicella gelatinilytica]